jgi:outer membrane protein assembly factor BamE (lipoprotein component of BamABCDE complex)
MKRLALLCALAFASACATIGTNFDSTQLSWLKANESAKADVLAKLGQPWRVGLDSGDQTWTYGYYEYRAFSDSNSKDLVIHFTPEGKVKSYSLNTSFPDERAKLDPAARSP